MKLEELVPPASVRGILPNETVTVVAVEWHGTEAMTLTYRRATGETGQDLLLRDREPSLEIVAMALRTSSDNDS